MTIELLADNYMYKVKPLSLLYDANMEVGHYSFWTASSATLSKDATTSNSGAQSLKIIPSTSGYAYQNVTVTASTDYYFSVAGKAASSGDYAYFELYDVTNSASIYTSDYFGTSFETKESYFTTPSGCVSLQIRLHAISSVASAHYDDAYLIEKTKLTNYRAPWTSRYKNGGVIGPVKSGYGTQELTVSGTYTGSEELEYLIRFTSIYSGGSLSESYKYSIDGGDSFLESSLTTPTTARYIWGGLSIVFSLNTVTEMITDNDMEDSGTDNWTANGGATVTKDTGTVHAGTNSLKVVETTGSSDTEAYQDIAVDPLKYYSLQGYIYSDGSNNASIIIYDQTNGAAIDTLTSSAASWTNVTSNNFQAPADCKTIRIKLNVDNLPDTVAAYFDDLNMIQQDEFRFKTILESGPKTLVDYKRGKAFEADFLGTTIEQQFTIAQTPSRVALMSHNIDADATITVNASNQDLSPGFYQAANLNSGTIDAFAGFAGHGARRLALCSISGICITTDSGDTWGAFSGPAGVSIVYVGDNGGNQTYVVGQWNGHVQQSTNDGSSWTDRGQLGSTTNVVALSVMATAGKVLAGSNNAIYQSTDWGVNWSSKKTLGSGEIGECFLILANDDVLCGTSDGKIYTSSDEGGTWDSGVTMDASEQINALAQNGDGDVLAFTDSGKIYKSTDNGATWSFFTALASSMSITAAVQVTSDLIYIAVGYSSVDARYYRSRDGGSQWDLVASYTGSASSSAISVVSVSGQTVLLGFGFSGNGPYVYKATDGGDPFGSPDYTTTLTHNDTNIVEAISPGADYCSWQIVISGVDRKTEVGEVYIGAETDLSKATYPFSSPFTIGEEEELERRSIKIKTETRANAYAVRDALKSLRDGGQRQPFIIYDTDQSDSMALLLLRSINFDRTVIDWHDMTLEVEEVPKYVG